MTFLLCSILHEISGFPRLCARCQLTVGHAICLALQILAAYSFPTPSCPRCGANTMYTLSMLLTAWDSLPRLKSVDSPLILFLETQKIVTRVPRDRTNSPQLCSFMIWKQSRADRHSFAQEILFAGTLRKPKCGKHWKNNNKLESLH